MKHRIRLLALSLVSAATFVATAADQPSRSAGTGPSFKGPLGLQLYSLRADFAQDVPGTLDRVKKFGFKYVELAGTYNLPPEKLKELLDARGLVAISGHFPFDRFRKDAEGIAKEAKILNLKYAGCAWIPHEGEFDEKECRDAIAVFNAAGAVLAKHGMKMFYHTHGYEFHTYGKGTLFDLMMTETKPELVTYEMDVFWIVFPAQDPVKLLQQYPNRWELMHVKDMKKGLKTGALTGKTDVENDVAIGTGQMNWAAILAEAAKVGVKYYFIEDESPTVAQQIPQSLQYLEKLKW
jgi:sugar phosphate isomerase/epimerase